MSLPRRLALCRAGFHAHKARRQRHEERQHLAAPKLLPNDCVDAVNLDSR
jgi:hypothetical protein